MKLNMLALSGECHWFIDIRQVSQSRFFHSTGGFKCKAVFSSPTASISKISRSGRRTGLTMLELSDFSCNCMSDCRQVIILLVRKDSQSNLLRIQRRMHGLRSMTGEYVGFYLNFIAREAGSCDGSNVPICKGFIIRIQSRKLFVDEWQKY